MRSDRKAGELEWSETQRAAHRMRLAAAIDQEERLRHMTRDEYAEEAGRAMDAAIRRMMWVCVGVLSVAVLALAYAWSQLPLAVGGG